jgi:hypothetical protein
MPPSLHCWLDGPLGGDCGPVEDPVFILDAFLVLDLGSHVERASHSSLRYILYVPIIKNKEALGYRQLWEASYLHPHFTFLTD